MLIPASEVRELINTDDPLNRRPQPDTPFFTETGAEGQGGPLGTSLGPLLDLSQIAEAADKPTFTSAIVHSQALG